MKKKTYKETLGNAASHYLQTKTAHHFKHVTIKVTQDLTESCFHLFIEQPVINFMRLALSYHYHV